MDFIIFFACAGAIALAGPRLVDAVEAVAGHTGLGRVWLGTIVLAGATSLPELVVTTSAGAIDEPDLAVGTVLGSNMFNMTIFAALLIWRPGAVSGDRAAAGAGIIAVALGVWTGLFLLIDDPDLGRVGLGTTILIAMYALSSVLLYRVERGRGPRPVAEPLVAPMYSLGGAVRWLAAASGVVFVASLFIPDAAKGMAETLGVSGGVIGVVALAFATSLPEVVTSAAAMRREAAELVVGNVFGSNIFNMAVLFSADVAFNDGSILRAASNEQAAPAIFGIGMMLFAFAALWRPRTRVVLRLTGAAIVVGYVAGVATTVALGIETG